MRDKIIKPDRRRSERGPNRLSSLADAVQESSWHDRRVYCWKLEPTCTEERRRRCSAHFVQTNCWDLWATEFFPPGRRPCCHPEVGDCSDCPVALAKFNGPVSVYLAVPSRSSKQTDSGTNPDSVAYCSHLYSHRDPQNDGTEPDFKCQRRRGIILHSSYVSDVCATREHQECIFYGE